MNFNVPFPNSYWVLPGEFLAGEHPGGMEEANTILRLQALLDAGIRTFVNLTEEEERMPGYARVVRELAADRGIDVVTLRLPIPDRRVPSLGTVRCALDVIDHSITSGNAVYVHCFAGIGRTGTMVGCHLRRHGRANEENVIERIAQLRRHLPGGNETSPHTSEQVALVRSWEEGV